MQMNRHSTVLHPTNTDAFYYYYYYSYYKVTSLYRVRKTRLRRKRVEKATDVCSTVEKNGESKNI